MKNTLTLRSALLLLASIVFLPAVSVNAEPVPSGPSAVNFSDYKPDNTGEKLVTELFNKAVEDIAKDPAKDTLVIPAGIYRIASWHRSSV